MTGKEIVSGWLGGEHWEYEHEELASLIDAALAAEREAEIAALQAKLEAAHADVRALVTALEIASRYTYRFTRDSEMCTEALALPTVRKIVEQT